MPFSALLPTLIKSWFQAPLLSPLTFFFSFVVEDFYGARYQSLLFFSFVVEDLVPDNEVSFFLLHVGSSVLLCRFLDFLS